MSYFHVLGDSNYEESYYYDWVHNLRYSSGLYRCLVSPKHGCFFYKLISTLCTAVNVGASCEQVPIDTASTDIFRWPIDYSHDAPLGFVRTLMTCRRTDLLRVWYIFRVV
jgi:hypothetical protein